MDDEAIAQLREDDPTYMPTALDRALYDLGIHLTENGLHDAAGRVADASAILHYFPLSPRLDNGDLRTLYDTLASMMMASATVAQDISNALSVLASGNGRDDL